MESVLNDNGQTIRGDAKAMMADASAAAQRLRDAGGHEVNNLMADVQDLLGRVTHVADPEIVRLRGKIERGLATAKKVFSGGTDQVQRHATDAMKAGDTYVHDQPWQAIAVAAGVGVIVGFLVAKR